jgi:hypothetical protein
MVCHWVVIGKSIFNKKCSVMRFLMFVAVAALIMFSQGCGESPPQGAPIKIYPPGKGPDKDTNKAPEKGK